MPGIDFTNDPLLQGRLFSYTDTQLSRLGGPNFHEIPINRPVVPVVNNQRDGMHRMTIDVDETSYHPNTISDNYPHQTSFSKLDILINNAALHWESEKIEDVTVVILLLEERVNLMRWQHAFCFLHLKMFRDFSISMT